VLQIGKAEDLSAPLRNIRVYIVTRDTDRGGAGLIPENVLRVSNMDPIVDISFSYTIQCHDWFIIVIYFNCKWVFTRWR
jgi:hypothetical protein